jgi:hypothetical protein
MPRRRFQASSAVKQSSAELIKQVLLDIKAPQLTTQGGKYL